MKKIMQIVGIFLISVMFSNISTPVVCEAQTQNQKEADGIDLPDGDYLVQADLTGGSGRASITSPAALSVSGNKAVVRIEWSSPNYDYMVLDGETYYPVNTEGNSVFELPVTAFDTEIAVTADTTAMSVPHEIDYTIYLHEDSLEKREEKPMEVIAVCYILAVIVAGTLTGYVFWKKRGKNE